MLLRQDLAADSSDEERGVLVCVVHGTREATEEVMCSCENLSTQHYPNSRPLYPATTHSHQTLDTHLWQAGNGVRRCALRLAHSLRHIDAWQVDRRTGRGGGGVVVAMDARSSVSMGAQLKASNTHRALPYSCSRDQHRHTQLSLYRYPPPYPRKRQNRKLERYNIDRRHPQHADHLTPRDLPHGRWSW